MGVTEFIRKIHTWTGLLSFSILLVFSLTGIWAAFQPAFAMREKPEVRTRDVVFDAPPDLGDEALGHHVLRNYVSPLANPIAKQFLKHDSAGRLVLDFYDVNGLERVTVFEDTHRLRIESMRESLPAYLARLHATTMRAPATDWRVRAWTMYVEFSVWSLLAMSLSGVWLAVVRWRRYV